MMDRALTATPVLAVILLASASCASGGDRAPAPVAGDRDFDLVDTAAAAGNLETLLAAAEAAGLLEELRGEGPYTLFAPTDAAFAALPEGRLERLLRPARRGELRALLRHHVVPGALGVEEALRARSAPSLSGGGIRFRFDSGAVRAGDARVVRGDIDCSNGVLHVVDSVLDPSS